MTITAPYLPIAPGHLPLLGHALQLFQSPLKFLESLPVYGDLVKVQLGAERAIVVCNPELTHEVLVDDRTFDKGGPLFERAREFAGEGLVTCLHNTHRRQRRLAQPAFHSSRLPAYTQAMAEEIARLNRTWQDGQVLNIHEETMNLASRTLLRTLFGDVLNAEELKTANHDLEILVAGLLREIILPPALKSIPGSGSRRFVKVSERVRQLLAEAIQRGRADSGAQGTLLSALIKAHDEQADLDGHGSKLTDSKLIDMVVTFFIAATESTSTTLSWCLYFSTTQPDIAARLRTEVDTVLAGQPASFEHVPNLHLTNKIIAEALRLYPPAWILSRRTVTEARLAGHTIAPGTTVVCSPYLIHHRPQLYPDPDRFDPDRTAPSRQTYLPFGGGARRCIGDQFGLVELTLALSTIVATWDLETIHKPVAKVGVLIRPRGLRMRPQRRVSRVSNVSAA